MFSKIMFYYIVILFSIINIYKGYTHSIVNNLLITCS